MDHEQRGHRLAARHPTEGHDVYGDLRPLLLSIAYRMVGSYSEAEDLVQEAFVRFHEATRRGVEVESAKAFLTTVTTRLAIDHLRSARVRRESYVGPWLPDPLVDEMAPDVARTAEFAESLSTAFLVLLETLSPLERAVFLLRDVFAYDYGTIAGVVDKSEDNCRQIAARARRRVAPCALAHHHRRDRTGPSSTSVPGCAKNRSTPAAQSGKVQNSGAHATRRSPARIM
jgi:RNA polymerase sigma factor (sigma-70 family)